MTLTLTPELLAKHEALKHLGVEPVFSSGEKIARGFADLGYEEFVILPQGKLLSLVRGTVSELPQEHRHHFFSVMDVDQLRGLLDGLGWDILEIQPRGFRQITLAAVHSVSGKELRVEERSLLEAFLVMALQCKEAAQ